MQRSPGERNEPTGRSLASTKAKFLQYLAETNGDKKQAKKYQNVIHSPLLDISFSRVCICCFLISSDLLINAIFKFDTYLINNP